MAMHFGYTINGFQISLREGENFVCAAPAFPEFDQDGFVIDWPVERLREAQIQVMGGPAASRMVAPGTDDGLGGGAIKNSDFVKFHEIKELAEAANHPQEAFYFLTDEGIQAAQLILRREPYWTALQADGFFSYIQEDGQRKGDALVLSGEQCHAYFKHQ